MEEMNHDEEAGHQIFSSFINALCQDYVSLDTTSPMQRNVVTEEGQFSLCFPKDLENALPDHAERNILLPFSTNNAEFENSFDKSDNDEDSSSFAEDFFNPSSPLINKKRNEENCEESVSDPQDQYQDFFLLSENEMCLDELNNTEKQQDLEILDQNRAKKSSLQEANKIFNEDPKNLEELVNFAAMQCSSTPPLDFVKRPVSDKPISWQPLANNDKPQQYFRYGDETWMAYETIMKSKKQPNQILMVPVSQESTVGCNNMNGLSSSSADFVQVEQRKDKETEDTRKLSFIRNISFPITRRLSNAGAGFQDYHQDIIYNASRSLEIEENDSFSRTWVPQNDKSQLNKHVTSPFLVFNHPRLFPNKLQHPMAKTVDDFVAQSNEFLTDIISQCNDQPCRTFSTYEDYVNALPERVSPDDIFCMVPGRLGLPYHGKKHQVSVGEILRRIVIPESLNISLLGPILRKAKSKNGSQVLRDKLHCIGVHLPQGRRKTAQCTLFTSLTESEAGQLAEDYRKICEYKFPVYTIAREASRRRNFEGGFIINQSAEIFRDMLILIDVFLQMCNEISSKNSRMNEMNKKLYEFDALTHSFGIKALTSSLNAFRAFVLMVSKLKCCNTNQT